jgi:hypothetical protein
MECDSYTTEQQQSNAKEFSEFTVDNHLSKRRQQVALLLQNVGYIVVELIALIACRAQPKPATKLCDVAPDAVAWPVLSFYAMRTLPTTSFANVRCRFMHCRSFD